MANAKVLVAKFVPDLHRMEPRNMGVIVWSPTGIGRKFLGQRKSGKVGECPDFVVPSDKKVYRQWVEYWSIMLGNEYMKDSNGIIIPRASPDYVPALLNKSKPGCALVAIAELPITERFFDADAAALDMFNHLVREAPTGVQAQKIRLKEKCEELLNELGVSEDPTIERKKTIQFKVRGMLRPFRCDYAKLDRNQLAAALKLIPIHKDMNVNSTLYMFEKMHRVDPYKKTTRCAVVDSREWAEHHKQAGANALPVIKKNRRCYN